MVCLFIVNDNKKIANEYAEIEFFETDWFSVRFLKCPVGNLSVLFVQMAGGKGSKKIKV